MKGHANISMISQGAFHVIHSPCWDERNRSLSQCIGTVSLLTHSFSTRVWHRAVSRDEKRWIPYMEGQWIARVSANHACRTISRTDEMKWNMKEPTQISFRPPRNTHGVTETQTPSPSGGRCLATNFPQFNSSILHRLHYVTKKFFCSFLTVYCIKSTCWARIYQ